MSSGELVEAAEEEEEVEGGGHGEPLLLSLPEDVMGLIAGCLLPSDVCSLILCCRGLRAALSSSEKVWLAQCERIGPPPHLLPRWRDAGGVPSYRSLCRFLLAVRPLLGIWVHQNPELGNVVCVVWGFLSVVGCRVIPQELGPLGLDASPLLWAPVFEVVGGPDGSASFFLHGREREAAADSLYPGSVGSVDRSCNVLLLEVGFGGAEQQPAQPKPSVLLHAESVASANRDLPSARKLCRSDNTIPRVPSPASSPFSRLAFGDRRKLLDLVAGRVRLKVPPELADAPLFPRSSSCEDAKLLAERRAWFLQLRKLGVCCVDGREAKSELDLRDLDKSTSRRRDGDGEACPARSSSSGKRKSFSFSMGGYLEKGLRQILGKPSSSSGASLMPKKNLCPSSSSSSSSSGESKHLRLQEFLRLGDTLGLSLRASKAKLSTYRAWPNMHDNRFALYKLPLQVPMAGQEYAGLWGGTFGWPPGQSSEDKPGKALFFLLLSYEEAEGRRLLIATKILEGTHYVLHPNGSAMFIVKVDEPSLDPFPWDTDGGSMQVEVEHSYSGEGIANGYGFRYPGSKPGSLFVIQSGLLVFVWKDSKAVLTLQRLDLQELLKKGEWVPALPPIANFAYLTKSFSNVFAGLPNNTNCSSSPR